MSDWTGWKANLNRLYKKQSGQEDTEDEQWLAHIQKSIADFLTSVVQPAFNELKAEFEKHGRTVEITYEPNKGRLVVSHQGKQEFDYSMIARSSGGGRAMPFYLIYGWDKNGSRVYFNEGLLSYGRTYTLAEIKPHIIIHDVIHHYQIVLTFWDLIAGSKMLRPPE